MTVTINVFFKRLAIAACAATAITGFATGGSVSADAADSAGAAALEHPLYHSEERGQSVQIMAEEGKKGNETLLTLLKIDADTLHKELQAGKSLAEIAKEKGVDRQKVIDLLVAQQQARLAEAVKSGKLTQEQAAKWSEGIQERTEKFVDRKGPLMRQRHGHMGHAGKSRLDDTAQVLGMTSKQLLDELKKGKSIAQVGKEKGISEEALVSRLLEKEKTRIKDRIHRTWDKANQVKQEEASPKSTD
ncbi:hypothetical protein COLU111180_05160 [Cohnella lubricantis]|uniref:LysM domain-containing protein n=1 Tax=Cohnella lubricantis TaxID=2163172 RepID=A0A841TFM2_9BACL|nr:hypothetical protein [Cohnella lubricantis]MBB6677271.1 hypothetical protein [Cohnella lubricantis]MBP2116917.1 lambda repressor-like predicted transcriptional regulator [Cohnella lubricantis]